jgi:hypothetical protein
MFFDGFNNGNYDFFELDVQTFLFKFVMSFHFHFVSYLASRFLTLTLAYVFFFFWCYSGCKHKSHWNCNKVDIGRDKSDSLSSDLVFSFSCSDLCHHTVKLPEQGKFNVINCISRMLVMV